MCGNMIVGKVNLGDVVMKRYMLVMEDASYDIMYIVKV